MDNKPMTKRELIREISDTTNLKPEAVKDVLDAFADIFIRESVMKGRFHFSNCFTVKPIIRKARKQYNVNKGIYEEYPDTEVLSITLSRRIHNFHRWKQRHEFNEKHGLTIEDWRNRKDGKLPNKE